MVVHSHRQHALGVILADHVIVEHLANVARPGNPVPRLDQRRFVLLTDDVHAEFDAFIADEDGRAGDQLSDLVLALAAERAVERILRVAAAGLGHRHSVTGWSNVHWNNAHCNNGPSRSASLPPVSRPVRANAASRVGSPRAPRPLSLRCPSICALDGSTTT